MDAQVYWHGAKRVLFFQDAWSIQVQRNERCITLSFLAQVALQLQKMSLSSSVEFYEHHPNQRMSATPASKMADAYSGKGCVRLHPSTSSIRHLRIQISSYPGPVRAFSAAAARGPAAKLFRVTPGPSSISPPISS